MAFMYAACIRFLLCRIDFVGQGVLQFAISDAHGKSCAYKGGHRGLARKNEASLWTVSNVHTKEEIESATHLKAHFPFTPGVLDDLGVVTFQEHKDYPSLVELPLAVDQKSLSRD